VICGIECYWIYLQSSAFSQRQVSKVSSERRQPGDTDKLEKAERNMIVGMQADKNVPEFLKKLKE